MSLPLSTGSGASLFVTERSGAATDVEVEALLFAALPSAVADVTFAVFVIVDPGGAFARKTRVNDAVAAAGSVAIVHETVPVAPTAGVEQVNAGPA